ncbi:MAG: 16S rRNA (guanine(966)-N(2))-methyltransferase RsmD [Candidatus Omnitrophota bacterium]
MKIIGGKFKGRNIEAPKDIRPVSVMVRKACFDIFRGEVEGRNVLDLFAGSGSLGIEALSQGACGSTFVDSSKRGLRVLQKNITFLGIDSKSEVHLKDSLSAVKDFFTYRKYFDIVFLDPPYSSQMLRKTLQALEEYDILTPSGYIVAFCYWKDDFFEDCGKFSLIVHKKYGQTLLLIYRKK